MLFEEDVSKFRWQQVSRFGRVVAPAPGRKSQVVVRGDIDIPQILSMQLSLERNEDGQFWASRTATVRFVPTDSRRRRVASVPGVR
jgi:hypothetical protein